MPPSQHQVIEELRRLGRDLDDEIEQIVEKLVEELGEDVGRIREAVQALGTSVMQRIADAEQRVLQRITEAEGRTTGAITDLRRDLTDHRVGVANALTRAVGLAPVAPVETPSGDRVTGRVPLVDPTPPAERTLPPVPTPTPEMGATIRLDGQARVSARRVAAWVGALVLFLSGWLWQPIRDAIHRATAPVVGAATPLGGPPGGTPRDAGM